MSPPMCLGLDTRAWRQPVDLSTPVHTMQARLEEANDLAKSRQEEITLLRAQLQSQTDAAEQATERAAHLQQSLQRARADAEQSREAVRAAEAKMASERCAADSQRRRTQDSHDEELAAVRTDTTAHIRKVTEQYEKRLSDVGRRLDGVTDHAQVRTCGVLGYGHAYAHVAQNFARLCTMLLPVRRHVVTNGRINA